MQLISEQHAQSLWADAEARHAQEMDKMHASLARLRGDAGALAAMSAEDLTQLAVDVEASLAKIRSAQVCVVERVCKL